MLLKQEGKMKFNYMIDGHLDLGGIILNRRRQGQKNILNTLFLEDFKTANLKLVIAAIFVETDRIEIALTEALQQIQAVKDDINESREFKLVRCKKDLKDLDQSNQIGVLLSLEGLEPINRNLSLIDIFYDLGVRAVGLTWSRRNYVADGSYFRNPREGIQGGLTPFGIEVVEKLEQLNIIIDVSHLNDMGFKDVLNYTNSAFIASHSNARAINQISRNLCDEQIHAISSRGGVIGVNAYTFIVDESEQTIYRLCDHIEHIIKIGGETCVGFGFDFCNIYYNDGKKHDVISYKDIKLIEEILKDRGYALSVIQKLLGENFYKLIENKLPE